MGVITRHQLTLNNRSSSLLWVLKVKIAPWYVSLCARPVIFSYTEGTQGVLVVAIVTIKC